jgi:thiamine-phosphate pyrophosphorylase
LAPRGALFRRRVAAPRPLEEVLEAALRTGARAAQLRDKGATSRSLLEQAHRLRDLTRDWGALLFVADRFDVTLAAVRNSVLQGFLIGQFNHEPDVAPKAQKNRTDHIACGSAFPTDAKVDAGENIGVKGLAKVASAVEIPVVGIGGVTPAGAGETGARTRAAGTAVIGAMMASENPGRVVEALLAPFEDSSEGSC